MKLPRVLKREIIGVAVVAAALGGLWLWQQQRAVPLPPGAAVVEQSINTTLARVTTLRGPWSEAEVRAFYRSALPKRGWRYCGTQLTPGCTNLFQALSAEDGTVDVYRRADEQGGRGPTIEIWPKPQPGYMEVRVFESREE
ncbi:MAG TPA: hypothetical protein VNL77_11835 [Roseiflexaceae bacterium]|nr:hypothetical protein [Roseiflexaceae bacterium]